MRLVDARRLHLDGLEAALQRGVLLDVFAIFVERGRADALQLPAGKGGLDDIGGIHRTFRGAGADDGVKLVDEKDDVLGAADFVHHRLDALLELAAVFRARDHERQVESDDLLVAKKFRHVAGDDFLGEAFGDGGLADAGLADQNRIVLGAAAKNLDDAFDLVGPPDDGIQFVLLGEFGEVASKGAQAPASCESFFPPVSGGHAFALFLRERSSDRVP